MNNSFMNLSEMPERTFEDPQNVEADQEKQVKYKCDLCGRNIYYADRCYEINGNIVCDREECTNVAKEELLEEHVMIVF